MRCAQTEADTRKRLKPRLPPRSNRFQARPGGGTDGAGTAVSKLREVDFSLTVLGDMSGKYVCNQSYLT